MLLYLLIILSILWFIRTAKVVLFWIYLWQLKEYHIGRFIAHFRTSKGRKLIFNWLKGIKILLLLSFPLLFYFLPVIYFLEASKAVLGFYRKRLKLPVLTKKTIVFISFIFLLQVLFVFFLFLKIKIIFWFPLWFLIVDIFTPLIVSLIILTFQPLTFLWMLWIMRKARKKREQFKELIVIGITGSYGKSSTKEFLAEILSEKFRVLKTKKNINSEIGIAQTILKELSSSDQVFIAEIGAYNRGKIKQVSKMLQPKIGILTGINEQHLATFGSLKNIRKAKYELIESLPKDGIAILKKNLDLWADSIKVYKDFVFFEVQSKDGDSANFRINLLGKQNVDNILLAASCAKKLGMSLAQISQACQKIKPEQAGMRFLKKTGPIILDSSYSSNPDGVIADLDYLKIYSGRKIIVMPCLIELGRASKKVHQRIGKKIAEVCDLAIITTKDYFQEMKKVEEDSSHPFLLIEKPKEIVDKVKEFCRPEDVVLLEGRVPREVIESLC